MWTPLLLLINYCHAQFKFQCRNTANIYYEIIYNCYTMYMYTRIYIHMYVAICICFWFLFSFNTLCAELIKHVMIHNKLVYTNVYKITFKFAHRSRNVSWIFLYIHTPYICMYISAFVISAMYQLYLSLHVDPHFAKMLLFRCSHNNDSYHNFGWILFNFFNF